MQKTTRLSLLLLASAALAASTVPSLGDEMKPYKGWIMFPPTTGADGASYSVRHDNIGGVGLRRAVDVPPFLPPVNNGDGTFTLTLYEEGVITYPDGSTIMDKATIVLVLSPDGRWLYGGSAESVITGGTGRFEGAHGWGNVIVAGSFEPPFDLVNGEPFRMPFEGMISTVGALQRPNPKLP